MNDNEFFLNRIERKKEGNQEVFEKVSVEIFGRVLSWEELKEREYDSLLRLMIQLEEAIKMEKSPYDVNKLAYAIQNSRSGMGGCAMTKFNCAFCDTEEMWNNTATPKICKSCAKAMATNIIQYNLSLTKDNSSSVDE